MVHRAHRVMSGGIDRIRARALISGGNTAGAAGAPKDDGAFASMITPEQAAGASTEAAPAANSSSVAWLQSNVADVFSRTAQDREARRHGRKLLDALAGLQRAALDGDDAHARAALTAALASLTSTVDDPHEADDPVLRLILREIAVRAAVELARAEAPKSPPIQAAWAGASRPA
jgi:hypothetical protein